MDLGNKTVNKYAKCFFIPFLIILLFMISTKSYGFCNVHVIKHIFSTTSLLLNENTIISLGYWAFNNSSAVPVSLYSIKTGNVTILSTILNIPRANSYTAKQISNKDILVIANMSNNATIYDISKHKYALPLKTNYTHFHPSIIPLDNGDVFIISSNRPEIYKPQDRKFIKLGSDIKNENSQPSIYAYSQAVKLKDGKVLIIGSCPYNADVLKCTNIQNATIFNPTTKKFEKTGQMTYARYDATSTLLNDGNVLVVGGTISPNGFGTNTAEIYNPQTGVFSRTGNLNQARYNHGAILLSNGKVLIVNGRYGHSENEKLITEMEIYDPVSGKFKSIGKNKVKRSFAPLLFNLGNDKVLISGEGKVEIFKY